MGNVIERVRKVAGQDFNSPKCRVTNPRITARESIELADYILGLERKLDEIQKVDRIYEYGTGKSFYPSEKVLEILNK